MTLRWMILALLPLALAAGLASGCSCASAHEIEDTGARPDAASVDDAGTGADAPDAGADAAVPVDAFDPGERYFTLEPAVVDLIVTVERCAENEGATAMLRVGIHYFSSCDTPGPVDVAIDPSAMTITITPHVWHEHGRTDCASIGAAYERDVAIPDLRAGAWTIAAGSTAIAYTIDPTSIPACAVPGTTARGGMCHRDCECAPDLRCLAVRGDAACARFCADPCETPGVGSDLRLSCPTSETCTSDPNLGWICATSANDACDDAHPCPAGMTCPPVTEGNRQCAWAIELNGAIRHACTTSAECDAGLDCVQRADGARTCEVRCTTSDMACPSSAPHACLPGNWVCEWLGE